MAASALLWLVLCLPLLLACWAFRSLRLHPHLALRSFLPQWLATRPLSASSSSSSSSSSAAPSRRVVLVVGGSFAGLTFCQELLHRLPAAHSDVAVLLVEPRQWFEYTPGVLRAVVRPSHHRSLLTPIAHTRAGSDERVERLQGVCAALTSRAALVSLAGGEERWVPFDYCVLAVGSGYGAHIKQRDTTTAQRAVTTPDTPSSPTASRLATAQKRQPTQPLGPAAADSRRKAAGSVLSVPALAAPRLPSASASSSAAARDPSARSSSSADSEAYISSAPSVAERLSAVASVHSALQASEEVHIVGAGYVGVVRAAPRSTHALWSERRSYCPLWHGELMLCAVRRVRRAGAGG